MCTEYSLNKEGPSQGVILIRMKKKIVILTILLMSRISPWKRDRYKKSQKQVLLAILNFI